MSTLRRYDIDHLRIGAIVLLIIYHAAICFQPWGNLVAFITSPQTWEALWLPMGLLNVWRIPLLFFISGMAFYLSGQQRTTWQILRERFTRIGLPYIFGFVVLVPIHLMLWQGYNHYPLRYIPDSGHLWFLGNLLVYVVVLTLARDITRRFPQACVSWSAKRLAPFAAAIFLALYVLEAFLVKPMPFELYAKTAHGFYGGFILFTAGYTIMSIPNAYQNITSRGIFWAGAGVVLWGIRLYYGMRNPVILTALESGCWVLAIISLGYHFLQRPGRASVYLSQTVYPAYVLHMIFLYQGATIIFPLALSPVWQYILLVSYTLLMCVGAVAIIRKIPYVRKLVGCA